MEVVCLLRKRQKSVNSIFIRSMNPFTFSEVTAGTNCISGRSICKQTPPLKNLTKTIHVIIWTFLSSTSLSLLKQLQYSHLTLFYSWLWLLYRPWHLVNPYKVLHNRVSELITAISYLSGSLYIILGALSTLFGTCAI